MDAIKIPVTYYRMLTRIHSCSLYYECQSDKAIQPGTQMIGVQCNPRTHKPTGEIAVIEVLSVSYAESISAKKRYALVTVMLAGEIQYI